MSRKAKNRHDLDWESEPAKNSVAIPEVRVHLLPPVTFNGEGPNMEVIAGDYSAWKVSINNWFMGLKNAGAKMDQQLEINHKMGSLKGQALLAAQDVLDGSGKPATWDDIIARLDSTYLGSINPQSVISSLRSIKQLPGQSVTEYAARWSVTHRRLVSIGVSNRDVAAQWFVDGLVPKLRRKVNEKLLEDQPLMKYGVTDAAGAVACVMNIALAKEQATQFSTESDGDRRWQPRSQGWRQPNNNQRQGGMGTAHINSLATDFAAALGINDAVIQQRLKAKECLNCGSSAHQMRTCPKLRQAKVNSMETDELVEKKNE